MVRTVILQLPGLGYIRIMFKDRLAAGEMLADALKKFQHESGIVLAVPRGGVPVAYAVVKKLGLPLELVLTKKIGHPMNKEYAIGAASLTDYFVVPDKEVSQDYIDQELIRIRKRLKEMQEIFQGDRKPADPAGKTLIVIDDGMATGNTLLATVRVLRKSNPAKIILAVPVASRQAVAKLSREVDEVIALEIPQEFYGVGLFYENFDQVSDEEVMYYLESFWKEVEK